MEKKTDAIVIRSVDYKDNDRILTLLTADAGKVTMGIKGVRKNGAKLRFAAEPFCFAEYVYSAGQERNTVISASLYDGFYPLREDLQKYYFACAVAELSDYFALPNDGGEMFFNAVNAVKKICYADEKEALVTFLLRVAAYAGIALDLSCCGVCGGKIDGKSRINFATGRFSCAECSGWTSSRKGTYDYLRKAAGMEYNEENFLPSSDLRALKLLEMYIVGKTDAAFDCLHASIMMACDGKAAG